MIVMHKKTGDLYQLIDDECKSKINGKWVDAVIYRGADKETTRQTTLLSRRLLYSTHLVPYNSPRTLVT